MDALDLGAHLQPQLGVEVGQRLVHQHERRLDDDRAGDRDALLLPARELARQLLGVRLAAAPGRARRRPVRRISAFGTRAHLRARSRCSAARSCAGRARSSGTPCRSRAAPAGARRCACSSSQMPPPVSGSSPARQLSAVDLPQPEGPSSAMNSPRRIVRSRPSRATAAPKRRVTPSRRSSPKPSATTSSPLRRRPPGPTC